MSASSFSRFALRGRERLVGGQPRVAILGTRGYPSYYGGFETAVRKLVPFLLDHGWDVTVYCRAPTATLESSSSTVRQVYTPGIATTSLSTVSFGLTAAIHALVSKPDVALVMNCANGLWIPLLRLRGVRVVINVDGIEWERQKWSHLAKAVFLLGARMSARWANQVVYDSREIERYWEQRFGREGTFIPYGGEPEPDSPGTEPDAPWAEVFPRHNYVLLVARFVPENTVAEFIAAAPEVTEFTHVVIVGGVNGESLLAKGAAELERDYDRVHWLRHIADDTRLHSLWRNCLVYFHGHSVGGTNPALVQAMALGAKIVARDTVYSREVISDCGWFAEPTPESIASTIKRAALELDSDRGEKAARRAEQHYSWPDINRDYHDCLVEQLRLAGRARADGPPSP